MDIQPELEPPSLLWSRDSCWLDATHSITCISLPDRNISGHIYSPKHDSQLHYYTPNLCIQTVHSMGTSTFCWGSHAKVHSLQLSGIWHVCQYRKKLPPHKLALGREVRELIVLPASNGYNIQISCLPAYYSIGKRHHGPSSVGKLCVLSAPGKAPLVEHWGQHNSVPPLCRANQIGLKSANENLGETEKN